MNKGKIKYINKLMYVTLNRLHANLYTKINVQKDKNRKIVTKIKIFPRIQNYNTC